MVGETLEEAAENYNDDFQIKGGSKAPHIKNVHIMNHFIKGATWQAERMYTYDDIRFIAYNAFCLGQMDNPTENKYNGWIEQFKK